MSKPHRAVAGAAAPRVLSVTLGRAAHAERRAFAADTPGWERVGRSGGSGLAVALLREAAVRDPAAPAPLVLTVGEGLRRGLPTAARATVASRAPLTGLYAEGQVGSDLGRRLSALTDGLVLTGRAELPGAVLVLGAEGRVELVSRPELVGLGPADLHRRLVELHGDVATLGIGPGGERELSFASLAAGGDPPHFVGRGGLGAVLGRLGLKALVVAAAPEERERGDDDALVEALVSSPRLESRARGGTLELYSAMAARGDLRERNYAREVPAEGLARIEGELEASRGTRHGCRGCPTPCGWTFDTQLAKGAKRTGARFNATYALGANLGLEGFQPALELLAACDRAGLDAKEVGAALALHCTAVERGLVEGESAWGRLDLLLERLAGLVTGSGPGSELERGAGEFARAHGLESEHYASRGSSLRPESNLAALLGQCVSSRGADPMRTFPFLAADAADRGLLAELLAPLPVAPGTEDPRSPAGKGRLVWWHENLSSALDAVGFCAFSAAALLSDRVCGLDELATWIRPRAGPGAGGVRLLEDGEAIVLAQRALDELWGAPADRDRPDWARPLLDVEGLWPEYRRLRGLDPEGHLTDEARDWFEARGPRPVPGFAAFEAVASPSAEAEPAPELPATPGQVLLRPRGGLATPGGELRITLPLPARLETVLEGAALAVPEAAQGLYWKRRAVPAVFREGRRVPLDGWVSDGDTLDLILAISGG